MSGELELDDMKEIIADFLVESDELVKSLDANLVKLESTPNNLDLLNEIFRAAHTIKGTSSFLGFDQVTELTHKMEDVLNRLRKAELVVTAEIMDALLRALDILKQLLEGVRSGGAEELNLKSIVDLLIAVNNGDPAPTTSVCAPSGDVPAELESAVEQETSPSVPAPDSSVPGASQPAGVPRKPATDPTIRVDVERLDTLMNLMGELVLGRNSLVQAVMRLSHLDPQSHEHDALRSATKSVNYITTELQMAVMKMRMQPIAKVFTRFPRLVRDLCRDSGKQIDLIMSGESTELDKSIIEEIGDPLVHIIRNSCDHGIESVQDRVSAGKSSRGTVKLSAGQEGPNIIIRIQDDGKGLDVEAIRHKAVERNLVTAAEIERLSDKEVFRFVFEPGFSTAKQITGVSGRGVGMDVVRTNIERLHGQIELESARGIGTVLTIKIPLTLAILQGLLVEVAHEVYVLPLSSVCETVRTEHAQISSVNGQPMLCLRDEVIPVVRLEQVLARTGRLSLATNNDSAYIVVVGLGEKKLGIGIDQFLGQEEVVIKSLGSYLGSAEGIAGATILGDGRVRLIVDLIGLFNRARKMDTLSV